MLNYNCPKGRGRTLVAKRPERNIKMRISEALQDERIDNETTVIIKDRTGTPIKCGRWYQDKILIWGSFQASFDFVAEKNIAILQLR